MRSRLVFPSLFLGSACSWACVPQFDDDLSRITTPRILAVRSEPAEAKPGEEVNLSVLIATPGGESSDTASIAWAFCLAGKPLTELGPVAQECIDQFGSSSEVLAPIGQGTIVTAPLPANGCRTFGPLGPPADSSGVSGRPADPDPSGGYYQPIVLGDESVSLASPRLSCGVTGLRNKESVKFASGYRPNENPEIGGLSWSFDGREGQLSPEASTSIPAGAVTSLRVTWAACPRKPVCGDALCTSGENQVNCREDCATDPKGCSGAETYLAGNPETRSVDERREGISVAWFATAGKFASEQTARLETDPDGTDSTNDWTAPTTAGSVRLWVVLRDDRGGVGWRQYEIQVVE